MKELLEFLVKEIVANPKEVEVTETAEGESAVKLTLTVSPEDMGIVIGKKGNMISSIRSLVKTAAAKQGKEVFVELVEK